MEGGQSKPQTIGPANAPPPETKDRATPGNDNKPGPATAFNQTKQESRNRTVRQHLPTNQWRNNVAQATRVMGMVCGVDFSPVVTPLNDCDFDAALGALESLTVPNPEGLCPDPKIIIRAEIVNARRYFR